MSYYSRAFLSNAFKFTKEKNSLFRELGVNHKLCSCLFAENITVPTLVQYKSLPLTLSGQNCIVQSATGTGKSLTFLIPVLQDVSSQLHSLIIVPSRELAIQLEHQTGNLISAGNIKQSVVSLYSGGDGVVKKNLPNIIVGTPNRVMELINSEAKMFKSLKRVVLDEVDKLMPLSSEYKKGLHVHLKPTHHIMKKIADAGLRRQLILTSASINIKNVIHQLENNCWGKNYHCICLSRNTIPKSIENLVLKTQSNKVDVLQKIFEKNSEKAMVVIHRNAPISQFVCELKQKGISAVPLHECTRNLEAYREFLQQHKSGMNIAT